MTSHYLARQATGMPTRQASLPPVLMINYPKVCIFNESKGEEEAETIHCKTQLTAQRD